MAIVHLAMFEAANLLDPRYATYTAPGGAQGLRDQILQSLAGATPTKDSASLATAISEAAYGTLTRLYPRKTSLLDVSKVQIALLIATQERARNASEAQVRIDAGTKAGEAAAKVVWDARANDGSDKADPTAQCGERYPGQPKDTIIPDPLCKEGYFPKTVEQPKSPFDWTIDPVSRTPLKLGSTWGQVKPFVIDQDVFVTKDGIASAPGKVIPLPKSTDARVVEALNEGAYGPRIRDPHGSGTKIHSKYGVRRYGADSPPANGGRTAEQTQWAQFWGYDATALLCAPPRLYNMVATSIYLDRLRGASADPHAAVRAARYLALINIALADAGIAAWDAKFKYAIARPVTFLRDHLPAASGDANWTPLGQVASNGLVPNTTPPFPAYPSGHATFGAAIFQMIGKILDIKASTRESKFDFVSDEYNGHTIGRDGQPRKFVRAHFRSLDAAKWENAESRIWLGVHWQQDADDGVALGDAIADAIYMKTLKPLR